MIREKDLDESIARYLGESDPTINTCIKLAACYLVKHELARKRKHLPEPGYSYAAGPIDTTNMTGSASEFARAINDRNTRDVWPIMDDLMSKLIIVNPRLYNSVMNQLRE